MVKKGLGKGLEALFENNYLESSAKKDNLSILRISEIEPNKEQPRKAFNGPAMDALAQSIKEHGVLQPILVKSTENGKYQIIAGERRWRAARLAGLSEVPVTIMELDGQKTIEVALIENIQRENLNPVEEAMGIRELMDRFTMTQEQASQKVGKSRSAVANALRLLALPEKILGMLRDGEISAGHARALLSLNDTDDIEKLGQLIVKEDLSVRQVEKMVQKLSTENKREEKMPEEKQRNIYIVDLEKRLTEKYGRKIKIKDKGKQGAILFEYYDSEDLNALLNSFQL